MNEIASIPTIPDIPSICGGKVAADAPTTTGFLSEDSNYFISEASEYLIQE